LGVPVTAGAGGFLAPGREPTLDELGARRHSALTMSASILGTPATPQVYHLDIDCGPRLSGGTPVIGEAEIGATLPQPLRMELIRYERVDRNGNRDFRDENYGSMLLVPVAGVTVKFDVHREDGNDERKVALLPTRTGNASGVTNAFGAVETLVTMGDVGGSQIVTGRIASVTETFTRAGNLVRIFNNPSTLTQATPLYAVPLSVVVDLTDSGSGIDLTTLRAVVNGYGFFDGATPLTLLPTFPDRLQIRVGSQLLTSISPQIVQLAAFPHVTLTWQPNAQRLRRDRAPNEVSIAPLADRAGNAEPSALLREFLFP
jgi:hypothetical protein